MNPTSSLPRSVPSAVRTLHSNDLALKIATVNGTGSASANGLLMQAIFRMGIPVSGKNIFPSNIQGLPTWYEIRVNHRGFTARTPRFDIFVAMNSSTYAKDIAEVETGGYLLYDSSWPIAAAMRRDDIHFIGIPLAELCRDAFSGGRERLLMKNIAYVGALAALLDVDREVLRQLLQEQYGAKQALMDSNFRALQLGYEYARQHWQCPLPLRMERMAPPDDLILIDGNTSAALGCLYAGATVAAWYPITPATSLMDAFRGFCRKYRVDQATGRNNYVILQAEDELSAAGMVIGAGWMGARAFTPTSGPGISLMTEFLGLAYYAEVPGVFFDVQRVGPSTGMPTRVQQCDLLLCAYASHGDTRHICLYPADPAEAFQLSVQAFDLAERYQTPVFVLSDLDIGMNDWRVPQLRWDDDYRPDRGKVLDAAQVQQLEVFHRYLDTDGDGIAARTLPGVHPRGAYFTRGSGHDRYGGYTEDADAYVEVMDRLARKIAGAASALPAPEFHGSAGARLGIVAAGSPHVAVLEAVEELRSRGLPVEYMRVRGFPFHPQVEAFLARHELNFVVDMNRDAQLRSLLALETRVPKELLRSVRYYGGLPISAHHVVSGVEQALDAPTARAWS